MAIDVFSRPESLAYLQRRVPALSAADATLVAEALGDLPLAIEQAGAWLAATGMPAAEYVAQLQRAVRGDHGAQPARPTTRPRSR